MDDTIKVTWVRFEAHHGAGHQSHTVEYQPFLYDISLDVEQDEILRCWASQFNNVRATCEIVTELPVEDILFLVRDYLNKIDYSTVVLKDLHALLEGK
jgi:hypothetical protein